MSIENDQCQHLNWIVTNGCHIGSGYCKDCAKEIGLAVLFDGLRKRMEDALKDSIERKQKNEVLH